MLDAISAEALKFRRHRATWGLVWIWPIGVAVIWLLAIGVDLANGEAEAGAAPARPAGSPTRSASGTFPAIRSAAI